MKYILIALACVPAHAEWSGTVDASFIAAFGSSETKTLNIHVKALKESERRDYAVELQRTVLDAESAARRKDSLDLDGAIRWKERGKWYTTTIAEAYADDYFRFHGMGTGDLERYALGYGGGYRFIEGDNANVSLDLTGNVILQDWNPISDEEDFHAVGLGIGAGIDANWWVLPEKVEIFTTTTITSGRNKSTDTKSGVRVGLTDKLHVAVKFDYRNIRGRSDGMFSIAVGGRF